MTTEIVKSEAEIVNPSGIGGDRDEISAVQRRIMKMIPGAEQAPLAVVWAVAQISVALDLNPIIHEVYIAKLNGKYQPLIATTGYETLAKRISDFDYRYRDLSEDEIRQHRGDLYDSEDYGVEITLRVYSQAQKATSIGLEYWPIVTYGFWRKKAQQVTEWKNKRRVPVQPEQWTEDNIPNGWTKIMVGRKRALRDALKRGFSLGHADVALRDTGFTNGTDEFEVQVVDGMNRLADNHERDIAPVTRVGQVDEDCLFIVEDESPADNHKVAKAEDAEYSEKHKELLRLARAAYGEDWRDSLYGVVEGISCGEIHNAVDLNDSELSIAKAVVQLDAIGLAIYEDGWGAEAYKYAQELGADSIFELPVDQLREVYKAVAQTKPEPQPA